MTTTALPEIDYAPVGVTLRAYGPWFYLCAGSVWQRHEDGHNAPLSPPELEPLELWLAEAILDAARRGNLHDFNTSRAKLQHLHAAAAQLRGNDHAAC